jgi:hypothetical protein
LFGFHDSCNEKLLEHEEGNVVLCAAVDEEPVACSEIGSKLLLKRAIILTGDVNCCKITVNMKVSIKFLLKWNDYRRFGFYNIKNFYTATPQAVVKAMNFIEERMRQLQRSSGNNIASLTSYTAR